MNLIINDTCNRACPYCFARSKVGLSDGSERADGKDISLDNFERYLDFHVRSTTPQLKLLGGEPTLHPEFLELLRRAHERNLPILVFTNGLWPRKIREGIQAIPLAEWKLKFLFNVNEPHLQPPSQMQHAMECMKIVGPQGQCGFNIYRQDFDLQFIADILDATQMNRDVRLGLASPIVGTDNSFINPDYFKAIGQRLLDQLRKLEERNVLGTFDCGFPLCMFSEDDLGSLALITRGFQSVCGFPIDVGPDLMAWPCFPLSNVENLPLLDFKDAGELREHFAKKLEGMRRMGALDDCLSCKYLERKQCNGGCVAHTLKQWATQGDQDVLHKLNSMVAGSSPAAS
ncbi:MAG: radical SAM protein [Terracidiphilus sp.]|jgi:radical SAM protein with 4Fe4S-binding SPASM domain